MKALWQDLVNKGTNFADFVRFCPYTSYTRTHQSLPRLWAAIKQKYLFGDLICLTTPFVYYLLHLGNFLIIKIMKPVLAGFLSNEIAYSF